MINWLMTAAMNSRFILWLMSVYVRLPWRKHKGWLVDAPSTKNIQERPDGWYFFCEPGDRAWHDRIKNHPYQRTELSRLHDPDPWHTRITYQFQTVPDFDIQQWMILAQWHGYPRIGGRFRSPPWALRYRRGIYRLTTSLPSGSETRVVWEGKTDNPNWKFNVRWHVTNGMFEMYLNELMVYAHNGQTTWNDKFAPCFKCGIYGPESHAILSTNVLNYVTTRA